MQVPHQIQRQPRQLTKQALYLLSLLTHSDPHHLHSQQICSMEFCSGLAGLLQAQQSSRSCQHRHHQQQFIWQTVPKQALHFSSLSHMMLLIPVKVQCKPPSSMGGRAQPMDRQLMRQKMICITHWRHLSLCLSDRCSHLRQLSHHCNHTLKRLAQILSLN